MGKRALFISIVFLFSMSVQAAFRSNHKIRVRVAKGQKSVLITGTDLKRINLINKKIKIFKGIKSIKYNCSRLGRFKGNGRKPVLLASLAAADNIISHDYSVYKGEILVMTSPTQDSCDVVLETDIDLYISQLLSKEMNKVWPLEALKAQAVAARTYAYHKIESKQVNRKMGFNTYYDLESSEKHQVTGDYTERNKKTDTAAKLTSGYVLLTKKGNLTPIFFHAKCGGRTFKPNNIWEHKVEGYVGVKCPYCNGHGKPSWQTVITTKSLNKFINWASKKHYVKGVIENSNDSNPFIAPDRAKNLKLRIYRDGLPYLVSKSLFRKYFGRFKISSNNFVIKRMVDSAKRNKYIIKGKGLGHGVGMCQLGALDLAKRGWDYKKILAHYFPGHKLKKIY